MMVKQFGKRAWLLLDQHHESKKQDTRVLSIDNSFTVTLSSKFAIVIFKNPTRP